jgi:hypothetical protein
MHDMPAKKNTIPTQLESILTDGTHPKHVRVGPLTPEGTARGFPSPPHPFPNISQRINRAQSPTTHTHHTHCKAHVVPQIVVVETPPIVETTFVAGSSQLSADQPHHLLNDPKTTQLSPRQSTRQKRSTRR